MRTAGGEAPDVQVSFETSSRSVASETGSKLTIHLVLVAIREAVLFSFFFYSVLNAD